MRRKPTEAQLEKARRAKKSLIANLEKLDIYNKFKLICEQNFMKVREGLREAVRLFNSKYENKGG
jgi:hypothetical protein